MDISLTIQTQNPAGTMLDYAGGTLPFGYVACDGSTVSRTTYARLFEAIGTNWGAGDGSTTFKLPDFRGRVAVGSGTGSGLSARTLGATGGAETHQLTESEIPSHTHTQNAHSHGVTDPGHAHNIKMLGGSSSTNAPEFSNSKENSLQFNYSTESNTTGVSINNATATNQNTGGGAAHNNMQPFSVCMKIIKY